MREYLDTCLKDREHLFKMIEAEHEAQIQKWGVQSCPLFEWMTYITEEVGELAEAILKFEYNNGTPEKIRSEAIQVATLSLKIAEMAMGVR